MNSRLIKKLLVISLAIGVITAGTAVFAESSNSGDFFYGMMGNGYYNSGYNMMDYQDDDNNGYYHMGGMMGSYGWNNNEEFDVSKLKTIDELKENVMKYLKYYNGNFKIDDIFTYTNSDYYFSIINEDTGIGAMELLVNPITGYVYPEIGPNMMWNTDYGMHRSGGYHGMMGGYFGNYNDSYSEEDKISSDDAVVKANEYLNRVSNDLSVEGQGHTFSGYYTFHVNKGEDMTGMLSVNAYTGDVWYHTWHGDLKDIISEDHE